MVAVNGIQLETGDVILQGAFCGYVGALLAWGACWFPGLFLVLALMLPGGCFGAGAGSRALPGQAGSGRAQAALCVGERRGAELKALVCLSNQINYWRDVGEGRENDGRNKRTWA